MDGRCHIANDMKVKYMDVLTADEIALLDWVLDVIPLAKGVEVAGHVLETDLENITRERENKNETK